jgi:hypothetical protein
MLVLAYFFDTKPTRGQDASPEDNANQPFVGGHGPCV